VISWKDKPLAPTRRAADEMLRLGLDLFDAKNVLEEGFDCSIGRRKKGTYERCIKKGKKMLKVVVVDVGSLYKITHVGSLTPTRKKMRQIRDRYKR